MPPLTYYRMYHLKNGTFVSMNEFQAADDQAAMAEARRLVSGEGAELWSGARKVGLITAR